jgi:hypothetical protein
MPKINKELFQILINNNQLLGMMLIMEAMLIMPKLHQVYEEMLMLKKNKKINVGDYQHTCMNSNSTAPEMQYRYVQKNKY